MTINRTGYRIDLPVVSVEKVVSRGARVSVAPPGQDIVSATTYGAYGTRKHYDAVATRGARTVVPLARTPNRRNPRAQAQSFGTRPQMPQDIWLLPSGGDEADTIAEAAPKQRRTV